MRHLFVMDPLSRINVAGDSTYVVMRACCDRGHSVLMCEPSHLYALAGRARARAQPVNVTAAPPHFAPSPAVDIDLSEVDVVWMRKDPPFDMRYVFCTYLLDLAPPETLVVNNPIGLKVFNEKIWAMQFADLHPPTLLSSDPAKVLEFIRAQPGRTVLKPWDGNGGRGILVTEGTDPNVRSMIELLTLDGAEAVIAQPYLAAIREGDKRIMLFDGEPVGAMLRIPAPDDNRGNMHVGASTVACDLTPRDLQICARLAPALVEHGQVWVGIDVIGDYLTEINITSPTGFQEIRQLTGKVLEDPLVDLVEQHLVRHREAQ
ncbi:MAG: glutathione synthase [Myxococcota bacterium]